MDDTDSTDWASLSVYYGEALEPLFCIFYDETITPTQPRIASAFFRDNAPATTDTGTSSEERYKNEDDAGTGGVFYVHNDPAQYAGSGEQMTLIYRVKDEWVNHGHEDSGHISISRDNTPRWVDIGRAETTSFEEGQTHSHNLLLMESTGTLARRRGPLQLPQQ